MIGLPYRTYYQLFPNRCIVGALFVVLLALCIKLEKPRLLLAIGYILTIFMFVWSNDCGLFMIVSWAAYLVCRSFSSSIKSCLWKIPLIIAMIPVSITASFGLTNLYNIAVGGKPMDFETFMFPIIGTSHIKNIELPLSDGVDNWTIILIISFTFLMCGFFGVIKNKGNKISCAYTALGVMNIGLISYAFNRAAYENFEICYQLSAIMLCIFIEMVTKDIIQVFEKKAKTTISRTICSYVALMAVVIMVFVDLSCIINISSRQIYFVSGENESSCDYIVI